MSDSDSIAAPGEVDVQHDCEACATRTLPWRTCPGGWYSLTGRRVCPPPDRLRAVPSRDAAYASLRLDCGRAPSRRRVCPPPDRLRASPLSPTPPQGGSDWLLGGRAIGDAALNPPPTRLGWRRTHTTPGCRPGLHETAATLLYKDGLQGTFPRTTHANRRIRGSPVTHDTAGV